MHPRLGELLAYTEQARAELLNLLDSLTVEQWEARAPTGGWTVRQVVGHLQLVESGSVRALFRSFRTARDGGLGPERETGSLLSSLDWSRLSEVVTPVVAPAFTTPAGDESATALIEGLAAARAGLRKWTEEADGYALTEVTFPHPRLGTLNLYQWVLMIGQHERRHTAQIRRILDATDR